MYADIRDNLHLQKKALTFLHMDLQAQYVWLKRGNLGQVQDLDSTITRLIQIAFDSRVEIRRLLGDLPLRDYIATLDERLGDPLFLDLTDVEFYEERCRQRAERNKICARAHDEVAMMRIGALYGVMTGSHDAASGRIQ